MHALGLEGRMERRVERNKICSIESHRLVSREGDEWEEQEGAGPQLNPADRALKRSCVSSLLLSLVPLGRLSSRSTTQRAMTERPRVRPSLRRFLSACCVGSSKAQWQLLGAGGGGLSTPELKVRFVESKSNNALYETERTNQQQLGAPLLLLFVVRRLLYELLHGGVLFLQESHVRVKKRKESWVLVLLIYLEGGHE